MRLHDLLFDHQVSADIDGGFVDVVGLEVATTLDLGTNDAAAYHDISADIDIASPDLFYLKSATADVKLIIDHSGDLYVAMEIDVAALVANIAIDLQYRQDGKCPCLCQRWCAC